MKTTRMEKFSKVPRNNVDEAEAPEVEEQVGENPPPVLIGPITLLILGSLPLVLLVLIGTNDNKFPTVRRGSWNLDQLVTKEKVGVIAVAISIVAAVFAILTYGVESSGDIDKYSDQDKIRNGDHYFYIGKTNSNNANLSTIRHHMTMMDVHTVVDEMRFHFEQCHQQSQQTENQEQPVLNTSTSSYRQINEATKNHPKTKSNVTTTGLVVLAGILSLTSRYGKLVKNLKNNTNFHDNDGDYDQNCDYGSSAQQNAISEGKKGKQEGKATITTTSKTNNMSSTQIALLCQEAAYLGLDFVHDKNNNISKTERGGRIKSKDNNHEEDYEDDIIITASFTLLALVAKNSAVRERHIQDAELYGLNRPIEAMGRSLEIAKNFDDNFNDVDCDENIANSSSRNDDNEQLNAEVQRKGCLLLGALADGDADMARVVGMEGGMLAILKAMDWYRYHEHVVNWGLWALFTLIYEYPQVHKIMLVRDYSRINCDNNNSGISVILQSIRLCGHGNIEVTRHGIAILFDLLRDTSYDVNDDNFNSNTTQKNSNCHPTVTTIRDDDDDIDDDWQTVIRYRSGRPILDLWKLRNAAIASGLREVVQDAIHEYRDNDAAADIVAMGEQILQGTNCLS